MTLEIISEDEVIGTMHVKDEFVLIEKRLTHQDVTYGMFVFTEEDSFFQKFSKLGDSITIIDRRDKQKISAHIDKTNFGSYRITQLDELMKKHYVRVGDIAKCYIDVNDRQISVEFVNIEIKKLTFIESRNQVVLALNINLLKNAGFEPGSHVNVIYGRDKIIIEKI